MAHSAALLLLADGRLPAGGYAHSGGLEPTVHIHGLTDVAGLEGFLEGRAATAGLVAASFAAAACRLPDGAACIALRTGQATGCSHAVQSDTRCFQGAGASAIACRYQYSIRRRACTIATRYASARRIRYGGRGIRAGAQGSGADCPA